MVRDGVDPSTWGMFANPQQAVETYGNWTRSRNQAVAPGSNDRKLDMLSPENQELVRRTTHVARSANDDKELQATLKELSVQNRPHHMDEFHVEESARKRLKDESGRPAVASAPSRGSGRIGALVKNDSTELISFLLTTEIIPLCLRIMETGSELSKTAPSGSAKPLRATPEQRVASSAGPMAPRESLL